MSTQTVICGDAVKLARRFKPSGPTVAILDPVWPNRADHLFPGVDAFKLLHRTLKHLVGKVSHVVLHLGCTTDPRFTRAVPEHWPFWRTCWLPYACPVPRQQALIGSDVAYVFGPARYPEAARIAPGESRPSNGNRGRGLGGHPCPRDIDHARWLVRWFSLPGETVLDPFCGRGTTLVAAKEHGRAAIGWEIDPGYCELARRNLAQAQLFEPAATRPEPEQIDIEALRGRTQGLGRSAQGGVQTPQEGGGGPALGLRTGSWLGRGEGCRAARTGAVRGWDAGERGA